jgi:hypothetical protein
MMEEASGERRANLLYLSQIDAHLATFLGNRKTLISDLATRLLLEPGVVITDTSFLVSAEIAEDLGKNSQSWVWNGLARGLIVPAFREKNVGSFQDNWNRSGLELESQQAAIIGILPGSKETLEKLDSAVYKSQTPRITWPERVGVSFGSVMNQYFTRDDVDSDSWDAAKVDLWRRTKDMRRKYLELGWERESEPAVNGLRRSAIFQAMATDVGFPGDPADTAKIIASADRKDRKALRATILWVDELYQYNHASCFKVRASFPVGKAQVGDAASMVQGLVWPGPQRQDDTSEVADFNHVVRWPGRSLLHRASPDKLLAIKTDEVGHRYADALKSFRLDPSPVSWDYYKIQAEKYATAVCEAVGQRVGSGLGIKALMRKNGVSLGTVIVASGATIAGGVLTGGLLPVIASAVAGGAALYVPIRDFAQAKKNGQTVAVKVAGTKHGRVQIDLPTPR